MVQDDRNDVPCPAQAPANQYGPRLKVAACLVGAATLGVAAVCVSTTGCGTGTGTPPPAKPAARLFYDWPHDRKPDVVFLLSGEQHGYLQPCGCSRPQLGGPERRYNFVQSLIKERGWPIVAVDIGNVAPQRSGPQALLKYRYAMTALQKLSYAAVAVGEYEMKMPLIEALGAFTLNNETPPVLLANLENNANFGNLVKSWVIAGGKDSTPKVGVLGVVGPSVVQTVRDADIHFGPNDKVINGALQAMDKEKPSLRVLLYQGSLTEAKFCAKSFPQFQVVQCLTAEEEPSAHPEKVGDTLVIGVGHKGRYIGLVGAYSTGKPGKPYDLYYQLVAMAEEYETPAGKEAANPILALLDEYAKEVKDGNYLAQAAAHKTPHPIQMEAEYGTATYVGSDKCKRCHEDAYKIWKSSAHAHAYDSLVKATRPALRQYDGECVTCHVTGFAYNGGYMSETGTAHLKENGCENCHGPASIHVKLAEKTPMKLRTLMNPFKTPPNEPAVARARRSNALDTFCQKCHDQDNDVNWGKEPLEKKLAKIAHWGLMPAP